MTSSIEDFMDENILISNRVCTPLIQTHHYLDAAARHTNLDLKVHKAYDYFSGSNFKSPADSTISALSSSEFICCNNLETEPSAVADEKNTENVRLSTIQEET